MLFSASTLFDGPVALDNGCELMLQDKCHPQTIAVCQSRAEGLGLEAVVCDESNIEVSNDVSGVLIQYPATDGSIHDYSVSVSDIYKPFKAGVCYITAQYVNPCRQPRRNHPGPDLGAALLTSYQFLHASILIIDQIFRLPDSGSQNVFDCRPWQRRCMMPR